MKKLFIFAALTSSLLTACSKNELNTNNNSVKQNASVVIPTLEDNSILVAAYDGQPVANAQVLIGSAKDMPFPGNLLTTDASGKVAIPTSWADAQSITVSAPGYVRVTYLAQTPGPLVISLKKVAATTKYEVKGKANGLPVVDFDGNIDFGLVMPAMTKTDMLNFDISNVISPINDQISTLGQTLNVPSNISLPRQQEKYSFFTATLDKPLYRVYLDQPGPARLYVIKGSFPFSSVADSLRAGQSFFDVINLFSITGGALKDTTISSNQNTLDLPTGDLSFTDKRNAVAPQIASDETFLAVATAIKSGYVIPTDIKNIATGGYSEMALLPKTESQLLGVVKKTADLTTNPQPGANPLSATLVPFTNNMTPKLLPLIAAPKFNNTQLSLPAIKAVSGINAIATYAILLKAQETVQGGNKVQAFSGVWEFYAPQWVNTIKLPTWPNDTAINGNKRWKVSFIGSQKASQAAMGPAIITDATHVTNSSLDF